MPTTLDVFISSKMVELKAERDALYKLLPTLNYGDIHLHAWMFENDAPATEKSIRDVYLKGLKNSALYIGLFGNQYSKNDQTPNWTIDEFERATEWGIERHIYVKDKDAEKRDVRLTEFLNNHSEVKVGLTPKWFKTDSEFNEAVRQSIAAWMQARQTHSTSPEAQLIRNPNDLRRPKKMFGREALLTQIDSLMDDGEKVLLQGSGGMGKTAVAGEAAARFMSRTNKPVLWLTIGSGEADVVFEALAQPARMTKEVASASGEAKAQALKTAVRATGAGLVILDNAWNGAALNATLNALPAELPVLVTSRQRFPLENVLEVGKLATADALGLLTYHSKREVDPDAPELCKKLGYLAFALEVAGKTMKMKQWASAEMMKEIAEAPHRLERPVIYGEQEVISVQDLLTASLHALPDAEARQVFLTFGAFFAPQLTPEMLQLYFAKSYSVTLGHDVSDVRGELSTLEQYGLAELIPATDKAVEHYQIHDLAYSYVRARNDDDKRQHALDACLAYVTHHQESSLTNFIALRPQLDNLLNGADWAFRTANYDDAVQFVQILYEDVDSDGSFLQYQGFILQSIRLLERASHAAEKIGNKVAQSAHVGNLGSAHLYLGQAERAINYFEQTLAISSEISDLNGTGNSLGSMGIAYHMLGQIEQAISYYEQALTIARKLGNLSIIGKRLGNLGTIYHDLRQLDKAIYFYEQSMMISRELDDKRAESNQLSNLGYIYIDKGEMQKAFEHFERSLTISREIGDRYGEGSCLGSLGEIYFDSGKTKMAIYFYDQALTIHREVGNRRGEETVLGNLGNAYLELELVEKAIDYHEQALSISREVRDRKGEGLDLGNLGNSYFALGQLEKAIGYYEQALVISREIYDSHNEGKWLCNLGHVFSELEQIEKAIAHYRKSIKIFRELNDLNLVEQVQNWINEETAKIG